MKRIKYYFYYIKKRIMLYFLKRKITTSDKGLYAAYYIINKYLTQISPDDYNQNYEIRVDLELENLNRHHVFERLAPDSTPEENRRDAAFAAAVRLTYFASPEMREKIYESMKNWDNLSLFKQYVELGVTI